MCPCYKLLYVIQVVLISDFSAVGHLCCTSYWPRTYTPRVFLFSTTFYMRKRDDPEQAPHYVENNGEYKHLDSE